MRYKINLERREVIIMNDDDSFAGAYLGFHELTKVSSQHILKGGNSYRWESIPYERRVLYAVARDELVKMLGRLPC